MTSSPSEISINRCSYYQWRMKWFWMYYRHLRITSHTWDLIILLRFWMHNDKKSQRHREFWNLSVYFIFKLQKFYVSFYTFSTFSNTFLSLSLSLHLSYFSFLAHFKYILIKYMLIVKHRACKYMISAFHNNTRATQN